MTIPSTNVDSLVEKGFSKYVNLLPNGAPVTTKATKTSSMNNREFIGDVLKIYLAGEETVFEVGSGTATQSEYFCGLLPRVTWQTSDIKAYHPVIQDTLNQAKRPNARPPVEFDIDETKAIPEIAGKGKYDAIYASNVVHCIPWKTTEKLFAKASAALKLNGVFILYGPYNQKGSYIDGLYTSMGNKNFDAKLKMQDPRLGLRELGDVKELAEYNGLQFTANHYHEASNNCTLIFRKVFKEKSFLDDTLVGNLIRKVRSTFNRWKASVDDLCNPFSIGPTLYRPKV